LKKAFYQDIILEEMIQALGETKKGTQFPSHAFLNEVK
jgi:hypothetical protein